jgi:flavodoxin
MNIGIVYYSHTGHTQRVVTALVARLKEMGKTITLVKLEPTVSFKSSEVRVPINEIPSIGIYDTLILATPVNGGRMSAPMRSLLDNMHSLAGIQVAFLITHSLPYAWGTKQTIQILTAECEAKGAQILGEADVQWFSLPRKKRIDQTVNEMCGLFSRF